MITPTCGLSTPRVYRRARCGELRSDLRFTTFDTSDAGRVLYAATHGRGAWSLALP